MATTYRYISWHGIISIKGELPSNFNMRTRAASIFFIAILTGYVAKSQQLSDILLKESMKYDSSYYTSFNSKLTGRVYIDRRYTTLKLKAPDNGPLLKYKPNTLFTIGIGATYRLFTLNLGFGFNFLSNGNGKGETHFLNLQSQWYGRTLIFDLFGQFYHGYYLSPEGYGHTDPNSYYLRPDLRVNVGGVAAFHILNNRKFSYRSIALQNEWQRKSAGSFLVGGGAYYGVIKGDSSLVPKSLDTGFYSKGISRFNFFKIGPGLGYAYTFVYKQHYFITGSITGSLDFNYSHEEGDGNNRYISNIKPNFIYRLGGGFNDALWNASISWVASDLRISGGYSSYEYIISAGTLRLTVAKRFKPGKSLKKDTQAS